MNEWMKSITSLMPSLALLSLGWTRWPVIFKLPWMTSASSGRSVLIPTRPAWKTESDVVPRCQFCSTSFSNIPGFEAYETSIPSSVTPRWICDPFVNKSCIKSNHINNNKQLDLIIICEMNWNAIMNYIWLKWKEMKYQVVVMVTLTMIRQ